jgi:hypothetical protein
MINDTVRKIIPTQLIRKQFIIKSKYATDQNSKQFPISTSALKVCEEIFSCEVCLLIAYKVEITLWER